MNADALKQRLAEHALLQTDKKPDFSGLKIAAGLLVLAWEDGLDLVEIVERLPEDGAIPDALFYLLAQDELIKRRVRRARLLEP